MPYAARPALRKTCSLPATPRRLSEADRRKTRRDALGLPGPVDKWFTTNRTTREIDDPDSPLSPDEVRCYVQVELKEVPTCCALYEIALTDCNHFRAR